MGRTRAIFKADGAETANPVFDLRVVAGTAYPRVRARTRIPEDDVFFVIVRHHELLRRWPINGSMRRKGSFVLVPGGSYARFRKPRLDALRAL